MAALSHNFAALMPGNLKYSYFPNSGSEAVRCSEMAYKYHNGEDYNCFRHFISW